MEKQTASMENGKHHAKTLKKKLFKRTFTLLLCRQWAVNGENIKTVNLYKKPYAQLSALLIEHT